MLFSLLMPLDENFVIILMHKIRNKKEMVQVKLTDPPRNFCTVSVDIFHNYLVMWNGLFASAETTEQKSASLSSISQVCVLVCP